MRWNYILFEIKMLVHNRKNWLLGIAMILFFPIYYLQYSQTDIKTLQDQKNEEAEQFHSIFKAFPEEMRETKEGQKIYDNLTEQASLINMQRFYLWDEEDNDLYITDGLRLNELRLDLHEAGNKGIHPNYIVAKEEIHKEVALLDYYQKHHISIVPDPFVASNYIPAALDTISGLPFGLIVLLIGSSMLLHDQQNRSLLIGLPVSFLQKAVSKVGIHLFQILAFLVAGIGACSLYVGLKTGWGSFISPVLLYSNGDFTAVSTVHYVLLQLLAFLLISLLLLVASVLVSSITKNMYTTVLFIVFLLLLPSLLLSAGIDGSWLRPLAMIDIGAVLSGEAAMRFASTSMDYKHAFSWFFGLTLTVNAVLYMKNKLQYTPR
ncbi:ABC transporter permease subunit [Sporosarcina gallistercoris]|uniref:ABC transporter permease subunit n=1 Tax=Sporosarcina gallistercoris TaxID=2762245 RepID=A0ABR8PKX2_9BACL|nr:ABC transporter permease subunit [Sporosarcina gallistercoris]MBD7908813.1 ABC transporter permease subunit [Sporosarcina gallistercoris]